jgi:hypothetical protein
MGGIQKQNDMRIRFVDTVASVEAAFRPGHLFPFGRGFFVSHTALTAAPASDTVWPPSLQPHPAESRPIAPPGAQACLCPTPSEAVLGWQSMNTPVATRRCEMIVGTIGFQADNGEQQ